MNIPWNLAADEATVVLYHFDEGEGNRAYDACGDDTLTLTAQRARWTQGDVAAAHFTGSMQDDELFVGPSDHPKLMLKTCLEAWTVEAWVRVDEEHTKADYLAVCGTDDEGFGLRGRRGGFSFVLIAPEKDSGLAPSARYIGNMERNDPWCDTGCEMMAFEGWNKGWLVKEKKFIRDAQWHHVAWQYRLSDQMGFLLLDGCVVRAVDMRERPIINNTVDCSVPFVVGGMIHSVHPPFFTGAYNFAGDIREVRISKTMRYQVTDQFQLIDTIFPPMYPGRVYGTRVEADGGTGSITYSLESGSLPPGLALYPDGRLEGVLDADWNEAVSFSICACDERGTCVKRRWTAEPASAFIEEGLPPAFVGKKYRYMLAVEGYPQDVNWTLETGTLPEGFTLWPDGRLEGTGTRAELCEITVRADYQTLIWRKALCLRVLPAMLDEIAVRSDTVFLYNWRTEDILKIPDACGDEALELTWTNMGGERKFSFPGREGLFPQETGHGEHGCASYKVDDDKHNLRVCPDAWTVEAWVRVGGPNICFGHDRPFSTGHVCGTYDVTQRGVWELYLSNEGSPEDGWAPGVHFCGSQMALMNLHPWSRPEGLVTMRSRAGIKDTHWHHIAWQFEKKEELHQLFLDGRLIWQLRRPDDTELINDRHHEAQFSVFTRLNGYCVRGHDREGQFSCNFNYRGEGNFFGQIGEIRVSSKRLYTE